MQGVVDVLLLLRELNVPDGSTRRRAARPTRSTSGSGSASRLVAAAVVPAISECWERRLGLVVNKEGYTRVGGTALGGASFLGLARALTSATTYREALALQPEATRPRSHVGRGHLREHGLRRPAALLTAAASLEAARQGNRSAKDGDVCRALLEMVAQWRAAGAAHAAQWRCQERVFFAGGFLDENRSRARRSPTPQVAGSRPRARPSGCGERAARRRHRSTTIAYEARDEARDVGAGHCPPRAPVHRRRTRRPRLAFLTSYTIDIRRRKCRRGRDERGRGDNGGLFFSAAASSRDRERDRRSPRTAGRTSPSGALFPVQQPRNASTASSHFAGGRARAPEERRVASHPEGRSAPRTIRARRAAPRRKRPRSPPSLSRGVSASPRRLPEQTKLRRLAAPTSARGRRAAAAPARSNAVPLFDERIRRVEAHFAAPCSRRSML